MVTDWIQRNLAKAYLLTVFKVPVVHGFSGNASLSLHLRAWLLDSTLCSMVNI